MSPTVFRSAGLRFFFSREAQRLHVHVEGSGGSAKFWLEPAIEMAENDGLRKRELSLARRLVEEHEEEIRDSWQRHFGR